VRSTRYVISSKSDRCSIKQEKDDEERCLWGIKLVGEKDVKDDNANKV
jgi:hypothetical protein